MYRVDGAEKDEIRQCGVMGQRVQTLNDRMGSVAVRMGHTQGTRLRGKSILLHRQSKRCNLKVATGIVRFAEHAGSAYFRQWADLGKLRPDRSSENEPFAVLGHSPDGGLNAR